MIEIWRSMLIDGLSAALTMARPSASKLA